MPTALGTIHNQIRRRVRRERAGREGDRVALRQLVQARQGAFQQRQQAMNPFIRLPLTEIELESQRGLQRIGFLIRQDEHEFVFDGRESRCVPAADGTLAGLTGAGLCRRLARGVLSRKQR